MKSKFWIEGISAFFIFLFIYTAASKWMDIDRFKWVLGESPLLGSVANLIAWGLPATEILIAIFLLFPKTRKIGLLSTMILMFVFTGYIAYLLATASNLPCSCGGILRMLSWKQHLVLNIFLTLLSILGFKLHIYPDFLLRNNKGVSRKPSKE